MDSSAILFACATHAGQIRERNEDRYLAHPEQGLWLIADGMGGKEGGEIASALVVEAVHSLVNQGHPLRPAIAMAHQVVRTAARQRAAARGMGSTVVALKLDQSRYEVCWVGDSRAYRWDNVTLTPLTRDHSYVRELEDSGIITADDARQHPQRNVITRALGLESVEQLTVDCVAGEFGRSEKILLCSDGLTSELDDREITEILALHKSSQATVDLLVQSANARGGRDNITAILVEAPADAPVMRARTTLEDVNKGSPARKSWRPTRRHLLLGLGLVLLLLLAAILFNSSGKKTAENNSVPVQDAAHDRTRIKKTYVPLDANDPGTEKHEQ